MRRAVSAYTLVEFLTTMAIASLLLGTGIPTLIEMRHSHNLRTASTSLFHSAMLARSEAVKRNRPVLVRARDADWSRGWIVFADLNNNAQRDPDEPLIAEMDVPYGIIIKGNSPVAHYLRYTPTGRAKRPGGAFQAGTLTLCHSSGKQPIRRLVMSASGRLRSAVNKPGNC
jgi:type IV fimbrial biogenesis protein FimT